MENGTTKFWFYLTSLLVSIFTYFVVFNLNNISRVVGVAYYKWRAKMVIGMNKETSPKWRKRSKQLETSLSEMHDDWSSEWWIFEYQLRQVLLKAKEVRLWMSTRLGILSEEISGWGST